MTGHEQQHPVEHKRYLMVDLIRRGTGQIRMFVEIHDDDAWNFDVYPGLPVLVDIPPNDGAVRILRRLESNKKFVKRT